MVEQEEDYHNFSPSPSHRLPTINGAQALEEIFHATQPIPTGLSALDSILGAPCALTISSGGVQPGSVTEVYGPPGVGKTAIGMQLAVNAIGAQTDKCNVTWIDTCSMLPFIRLHQMVEASDNAIRSRPGSTPATTSSPKPKSLAEHFDYRRVTSLPHLLTLFVHPTPDFPPQSTRLVVVDDLSNFLSASLPRSGRSKADNSQPATPKAIRENDTSRRMATRRAHIISSLATAMQKFAAARNVAIVVLNQTVVSQEGGQRAALRSALNVPQWASYIMTRIVLYRDFWPLPSRTGDEDDEKQAGAETIGKMSDKYGFRVARVERLEGREVQSRPVGFIISESGVQQIEKPNNASEAVTIFPQSIQPTSASEKGLEVEDQEDIGEVLNPYMGEDDLLTHGENAKVIDGLRPKANKRKAIEMGSSDDSDRESKSEPDLPSTSGSRNDFQRSSQLHHSNEPHDLSIIKPKERAAEIELVETAEERDEMLLEQYEKELPPFSQAALNLTDPLTPSDDGRGSP